MIILGVLLLMNLAATLVCPFIGSFARLYRGVLVVSTFWDIVLLSCIWFRQEWARITLAMFLFGYAMVHLLYIPEMIIKYPGFLGEGMHIILVLIAFNVLAGTLLIVLRDLRFLCSGAIVPRRKPWKLF